MRHLFIFMVNGMASEEEHKLQNSSKFGGRTSTV